MISKLLRFLAVTRKYRLMLLGVAAIALGLWSMHVTYVPTQTWKFNLVYVWPGQFASIVSGIALLYALDRNRN